MTKDTHVESISGEITLYDLIAWEPRLQPIAPQPGSSQWHRLTTIAVDWILTARSTQPILPTIRGGELIVLSDRIVREIGVSFAALMREISTQPIAGILTDHTGTPDPDTDIPVIRTSIVDAETERDLNRLLTNGKRDAFQRVAEIDQVIADAGARSARPSELMDRISQLLQLPLTILTPGSATLFTTASSRDQPEANSTDWIKANLRSGYTLWIGPIPPSSHALARFALHHIRDGLQRALDSSQTTTPRGNARVAALNALITSSTNNSRDQLAQKALSTGLPSDRMLRIAITSEQLDEAEVRRSLQQLGDVLDAGEFNGNHLWLLASRVSVPSTGRILNTDTGWVALSAQISSPSDIPTALKQANFVRILVENQLIARSSASFEDTQLLGLYGLLFAQWGSEEQRAYRDYHLGALIENDPRGHLLETLGVFLDQGGSQRLTAEAIGIHRNTLSYRLRQIQTELPVDLDDPHTRLTVHVAIAIHRLLTL